MQPTRTRDVSFVVPVRGTARWLDLGRALVVAIIAGLVLGCADRVAQSAVPFPYAGLANSAAVWALGAFVVGFVVVPRTWFAAAAGVVTLVCAVESYYLLSAVAYGDGLAALTARTTQLWLGFAVVVGALLGAAGAWARSDDPGVRVLGLALAPAVLFAEVLNLARLARRPGGAATGSRSLAELEALLGLTVLVALALFVARRRFDRVAAAALCVPLALLGYGLYTASGYGG